MRQEREKRILRAAEYIVEHRATVRETAKRFGVSKSTIHKDVTERLRARWKPCCGRTRRNVICAGERLRGQNTGAESKNGNCACRMRPLRL